MKHPQLALTTLAVFASHASANDLIVQPGESIQAAIGIAVNGDRILIEPGTYFENIDLLGKAIEVIGTSGADVTTIDGGDAGPVVALHSAEGPDTRIAGLTIQGGSGEFGASWGGGISAINNEDGLIAAPTVEDCILRDNRGTNGGGFAGNGTLRRVVVHSNVSTTSDGGGIYGAPTLDECLIANNSATDGWGGGVYVWNGHADIRDSVVVANASVFSGRGGGIAVGFAATATVDRCIVIDNDCSSGQSTSIGCGISVEIPGTQILRSTIVGNDSSQSFGILGGGVRGPAEIVGTIVRGNGGDQLAGTTSVTYSNV